MKHKMKENHDNSKLYLSLGIGLAAGVATGLYFLKRRTIPKGVEAVKTFNLQKYMGAWYEIARFNYLFEKGIDYATAEYSLNDDGSVKVVNRGYNYIKQKETEVEGVAFPVGKKDEAMFKVSFCKPFYAGYNVIAIDKNYKYALIAGRSRNYLWILSKEKQVPEKVINEYLEKAENLGFDTSKLVWTKYK